MATSTEAQRKYIDSLARNRKSSELAILLAPAFQLNSNTFIVGNTLNQNTKKLTSEAASSCIVILKAENDLDTLKVKMCANLAYTGDAQ